METCIVQLAPGASVLQSLVSDAKPLAEIELMRALDVPTFQIFNGKLLDVVPSICGGYDSTTSGNHTMSPMALPALLPGGRATVKVWLAGLASLLIVSIPAARLPLPSET